MHKLLFLHCYEVPTSLFNTIGVYLSWYFLCIIYFSFTAMKVWYCITCVTMLLNLWALQKYLATYRDKIIHLPELFHFVLDITRFKQIAFRRYKRINIKFGQVIVFERWRELLFCVVASNSVISSQSKHRRIRNLKDLLFRVLYIQ